MAETDTSPAALRAVLDDLDEFVPQLREAATAIEHHAWDGTSQDAALCSSMASAAADNLDLVMGLLRALAAEKEAGAPAPDADGWIPWEGGRCPVPDGAHVRARTRDGGHLHWVASELEWAHRGHDTDVVAYCVSKEG